MGFVFNPFSGQFDSQYKPQLLGTTDSPTFGGLTSNGSIAMTSTVGLIAKYNGSTTTPSYWGVNTNGSMVLSHNVSNSDVVQDSSKPQWRITSGLTSDTIQFQHSPIGATWNQSNIFTVTGTGYIGLGTTSPTHTLTLPSTSTGIAIYNTSDQTTNYERGVLQFTSNELLLSTQYGGTAIGRNLRLSTANGTEIKLANAGSTAGYIQFLASKQMTVTNSIGVNLTPIINTSSGVNPLWAFQPTISQSGSAGYTAVLINPTENTTGSGSKLLIDGQVGGVSKFSVSNGGVVTSSGGLNANGNSQFNGSVTVTNGNNLVFGTTTGTKIGTSTSQKLAFHDSTPIVQDTGWAVTNVTEDRTFDADATTLDEVADVLGTLINKLKDKGLIGA